MASLTQRLRLKRHTLSDRFRIQDYTDNWVALDAHPGTFICTSTTRPSDWTASQTGMFIFETDTLLRFVWDGDSFERVDARGEVVRAERLADISTTSTTYVSALSTPSTQVYNQRHLVVVESPGVYNTNGLTGLSIWRDGTMLQEWVHQGWTGSDVQRQPRPLSFVTTDLPVAGAVSYSLQFRAVVGYGGTSYVTGGTNKPLAITVVEV